MTFFKSTLFLFAIGLLAVSLAACDSTSVDDDDDARVSEPTPVEDLAADPQDTDRFTFFSLRENGIVLRSSTDADRDADSTSTQWDLGFRSTSIIVNGGASGPGEGAAYVAETAFQEVTEVETERLVADGAEQLAIPTGSGNGWYHYNRETHIVTPLPGRTLVVRTADGEHYAKIRIQSYYEGAPANPTLGEDNASYYTFDYVLSDEPSFE